MKQHTIEMVCRRTTDAKVPYRNWLVVDGQCRPECLSHEEVKWWTSVLAQEKDPELKPSTKTAEDFDRGEDLEGEAGVAKVKRLTVEEVEKKGLKFVRPTAEEVKAECEIVAEIGEMMRKDQFGWANAFVELRREVRELKAELEMRKRSEGGLV